MLRIAEWAARVSYLNARETVMKHLNTIKPAVRAFAIPLFFLGILLTDGSVAGGDTVQRINIELGDYRFRPNTIELTANQPVELVLTNTDFLTPHNFTLSAPEAGLEVNTDVQPGLTVTVKLRPQVPGSFEFFCNQKLLFMKSHREQGMEGRLIVRAP